MQPSPTASPKWASQLPPPPPPLSLLSSGRAQSTDRRPRAPQPVPLRRHKSDPMASRPRPCGLRFTDRLLDRLTATTAATAMVPSATEELVAFGRDPPQRSTASSRPGSCAVCFEEKETVQLCWNQDCKKRFCSECVEGFCKAAVSSALYAVPWLRCPGCQGRLATEAWSEHAPEAYETYRSNAEALFAFRCADCDEVGNLLLEHRDKDPEAELSPESVPGLREAWRDFAYATKDPDSLLALLPKEPEAMLSSIKDLERRACLQLALLRRKPFIETACCDSPFCFKCKVSSHHEDQTCEERQREELDIHCQFCPECEVPTVRTEGCDHIVCVCGADWTWQEIFEVGIVLGPASNLREMLNGHLDVNWQDEDGKSLLMYASEGGNLANVQILLDASADINARDASNISALVFALCSTTGEHDAVAELLLDKAAEVCRADPFMALEIADVTNALSPWERLFKMSGIAVDDCEEDERTMLKVALQKKHMDVVRRLITTYKATVHMLAPFWFVDGGNFDPELFDEIFSLSGMLSVDETAKGFDRLVTLALSKSKPILVRHLLVKHKATATFAELVKSTGFWVTAQSGAILPLDLFELLLERGVDLWAADGPNGTRGFFLSQLSGTLQGRDRRANADLGMRVVELWRPEADFFAQSETGSTVLHKAIDAFPHVPDFSVRLAKVLIHARANIETKDGRFNFSALHAAVKAKSLEIVNLLLEARADVLATGPYSKETAGALAAKQDWLEGATVLLSAEQERREAIKAEADAAAEVAAASGDGTVTNVGLKLTGSFPCEHCQQRYTSSRALEIHWRFTHDPSRHPED
mmetsp:Transcript_56039/g.121168  ORF Transcript_56039/g.121168 Transcript_56039/m.121168 type:complete len:819 (+) Transcript_56039:55-2511(+)